MGKVQKAELRKRYASTASRLAGQSHEGDCPMMKSMKAFAAAALLLALAGCASTSTNVNAGGGSASGVGGGASVSTGIKF